MWKPFQRFLNLLTYIYSDHFKPLSTIGRCCICELAFPCHVGWLLVRFPNCHECQKQVGWGTWLVPPWLLDIYLHSACASHHLHNLVGRPTKDMERQAAAGTISSFSNLCQINLNRQAGSARQNPKFWGWNQCNAFRDIIMSTINQIRRFCWYSAILTPRIRYSYCSVTK